MLLAQGETAAAAGWTKQRGLGADDVIDVGLEDRQTVAPLRSLGGDFTTKRREHVARQVPTSGPL